MDAENVLARIVDNPRLPTPPALTLRILEYANRPNCSIAEIGKMLGHDPALCGKMLKLVNSSLFGLHRAVTSIDRALNLLGLNHVRSLVLSLSLPSLRFQSANNAQMMEYWKSSVTIAIVCRELAIRKKWADPDSEMVAGLLCDLGIMLLQDTFPEQAARIAAEPAEVLVNKRCAMEREQIGVDHAEAGAYFLARWNLSVDLTESIRFHHQPSSAPPAYAERAALLYFASRIAQLHQTVDQAVDLGEIVTLAREQYGLDDAGLLAFLESLNTKIDEFATLIDVDFGAHESFTDLFAKATENLTKLAVAASLDNFRIHEEKSQVERNLEQATKSLQMTEERLRHAQKMEAIGRLAGGISHDFNNLLTVIVGNCELLLEAFSLDDEVRTLIDTIKNAGSRAADLTKQLLAFSRKQRLVAEVIQLNAVISNVSRILSRLLGDDIQLVTRLSNDLERIKFDPGQIEQVILNLSVNARDAMPKGGCLTIETFNLQLETDVTEINPDIVPGNYVVLAVRDTGCGMDESTLRQVFEPFFTTKEIGKGTGLGLATVHGIVRQSGGHITVSSVVGEGTVFHIYLPAANEPLSAPKTPPLESGFLGGTETILLVEDEESVRDFTQRTLAIHGYQMLVARNGIEALEIEARYPEVIHLLITDRVMPWMNGSEVARRLTQNRPGIRVIFTSGFTDERGDQRNEEIGAAAFLQKPFTSKKLATLIREVLGPAIS